MIILVIHKKKNKKRSELCGNNEKNQELQFRSFFYFTIVKGKEVR